MLNREPLNRLTVFNGDAPLTSRQRQTAVFVVGTVAVLGAIVLSFSGLVTALAHRDDPVAMQAVAGSDSDTTAADGASADGLDRLAPFGDPEADAPTESGTGARAAPAGGFTGTYRPSSKGASPLSPTATSVAPVPAGDPGSTAPTSAAPGSTAGPSTTGPESSTTSSTRPGSTTSETGASSTTSTTRPGTTTTTTRVTVTEATSPPTVITLPPTTRPPTTLTVPPTTAPPPTAPPSSPIVGGPVS